MKGYGKTIYNIILGIVIACVIGVLCGRLIYYMRNLSQYRLQFSLGHLYVSESPIERDQYLQRFYNSNDFDERCYLTDQYLNQYPNSPFAINNKAYLLIEAGDALEGIRLTEELLRSYGGQSEVYNNLGWAYNELQQHDLALYYTDMAVACHGGQAAYRELVNRGDAYQGLLQYEEAAEQYLQAIRGFPAAVRKYAPYCHQQLAYTYRQMGDNVACLQINLEILEMLPDNYAALYEALTIYCEMEDAGQIVRLGLEYLANNPDEHYVNSYIGDMLFELERYEQAAGFYVTYAELSEYSAYGYYLAAKSYVLADNPELARRYIELCLEQEPEYLDYMEEPELWGWLDD